MKIAPMTFLELFRNYIAYHSQTNIEGHKRDYTTIKAYENKYAILAEYLSQKQLIKLKPQQFTIVVADDLFDSMSFRYQNNYAARIVEICRLVLSYGARKMLIAYNPIASWKIRKTKPSKPVHLVPGEIFILENYTPVRIAVRHSIPYYISMPKQGRIVKKTIGKLHAAVMFLSQCYTGFDYSDVIRKHEEYIINYQGRQYLEMKRKKKSGGTAIIPYFDKTKSLLERYGHNVNLLCNPRYNEYIKHVAKECGIDKHLTTHVGRKTFAMIKLNHEGYSMEAISGMLGHTSVKTTEQHYAWVDINRISLELTKLGR